MRDAVDAWAVAARNYALPPVPYKAGDWYQARRIFQVCAPHLRNWDEAPQMIDELTYALHRIELLTSPARSQRRYVGPCPECGVDVTVRPEAEEAACHECGTRFDVGDALAQLYANLAQLWLPREQARRAAEMVSGQMIPQGTLKTWIAREKIKPRQEGKGPALYRVGAITRLLALKA